MPIVTGAGGGSADRHTLILSGLSALVAGSASKPSPAASVVMHPELAFVTERRCIVLFALVSQSLARILVLVQVLVLFQSLL